ncbi:MAG: transposase, partial [Mycolicibacterium sp.]|nr:transposase [Mycolicibacterium sp.]
MQYDPPMLTTQPANGLTCGIDWARDDHVIAIVDCNGRQVHRSTVEHSSAGLRELVAVLARTGATEVAIERPDGPVVTPSRPWPRASSRPRPTSSSPACPSTRSSTPPSGTPTALSSSTRPS